MSQNHAVKLFDKKKFKESIQEFEKIVANEPKNVTAFVYMARAWQELDPSSVLISKLLKNALSIDKSNAYTLFTMGCYYFKRFTFKPAIKYFLETLKVKRNHSGAAYNLGVCYDNIGDYNKSLEYYQITLDLEPNNSKALTNKAIALDKLNRSQEARAAFEQALKIEKNAIILNNYAICLKKLRELDLASKSFELACELSPEYSISHYNLAVHLSETNEIEKSLNYYKKTLQLDSSHVLGCLASASSLESQEKYYSALKIYEVILEALPDLKGVSDKILVLKKRLADIEGIKLFDFPKRDVSLFWNWTESECLEELIDDSTSLYGHLRLGILLTERLEYLKAKKHFNQILIMNDQFHPDVVHEKLGDVYFRKDKDFQKAKESYLAAIAAKEKAELWVKCGRCFEKMKNFEEACKCYEKALQVDQAEINAFFRLGWGLMKKGDRETGLDYLEKGKNLDPENPKILMRYGDILVRDGKLLEEALDLLQKSFSRDPSSVECKFSISKCYEKMGKFEEAINEIETLLELPDPSISVYFHLANLHEKNDREKSIGLYEKCLEIDRKYLPALIQLATLLANNGESEKAKGFFKEVIQIDTENITAHFSLGKINQRLKNFNEAVLHFEIVIGLDKSHFKAFCQMGIIYFEKGDYKRALECLKESIEINPSYVLGYVYIGNVNFEKGTIKDSVKYYKEAIKLAPDNIQALVGLGNAFYKAKKSKESIKYYERALEIDKNQSETYFNLGNAFYMNQNIDKAIECYTHSIELNKSKPETHYNLANAYSLSNLPKEAIPEFLISITLDPTNQDAYYNLANTYCMTEQFDLAIANYKEAIYRGLNTPESYFNLGLVYYKSQDYSSALEQFTLSSEIEPNNYEILYYLGTTLHKLGNQEGISLIEKSLKIKPGFEPAQDYLRKLS